MTSEDGAPLVRLANAHLEVEVDPGLGAEIRSVRRPGGPNVLARYEWSSPLPVRRSSSYGDEVLDWLSDYRGGWQELFPNAGDACIVDGVRLPFHGEVSRARWEVVASAPQEAILRTPARLPLVLERRMRLAADRPALLVEETIRSDAPVPSAFLIGHHPAFVAAPGAWVDLPEGCLVRVDEGYVTDLVDLAPGAQGRWPSVAGRSTGVVRLDRIPSGPVQRVVFATALGTGPWAAVRAVHPGLGVALAWDGVTFPCAWLWWEIGGRDFPWHGRARIVAIEPNTDCPADGLTAARSRGTAHELGPGAEHRTWLTLALFEADERRVLGVGRDGVVRLSP